MQFRLKEKSVNDRKLFVKFKKKKEKKSKLQIFALLFKILLYFIEFIEAIEVLFTTHLYILIYYGIEYEKKHI